MLHEREAIITTINRMPNSRVESDKLDKRIYAEMGLAGNRKKLKDLLAVQSEKFTLKYQQKYDKRMLILTLVMGAFTALTLMLELYNKGFKRTLIGSIVILLAMFVVWRIAPRWALRRWHWIRKCGRGLLGLGRDQA